MTDPKIYEERLEQEELERKVRFEALVKEAAKVPPQAVVPEMKPMPRPVGTPKTAADLEEDLARELARMRQLRIDTQP